MVYHFGDSRSPVLWGTTSLLDPKPPQEMEAGIGLMWSCTFHGTLLSWERLLLPPQPHISDSLLCQPQHCCHYIATRTGRGADLAAKHRRDGKKKKGGFKVQRHYCRQKGACRKTRILGKGMKLIFLLGAV